MDARSAKFPLNKQLEALAVYRKIYGDLSVGDDYVVPPTSRDWPADMLGVDLGNRARLLRQAKVKFEAEIEKKLNDMGFLWNRSRHYARFSKLEQPAGWIVVGRPWHNIFDGLATYHRLVGHCRVPGSFIVPSDNDTWPVPSWGLVLAECVKLLEVHMYQLTPQEYTKARSLGLLEHLPMWFEVIELFDLYDDLHGNVDIPIDFDVPPLQPWPSQWHGLHLGELAWKLWIYESLLPSSKRHDLDDLGFDFNTTTTWARTLQAARVFLELFQHLAIPLSYVVPMQDASWPTELWGMRLGAAKSYFDIALRWHFPTTATRKAWRDLVHAEPSATPEHRRFRLLLVGLHKHRQFYGHVNVPPGFVIGAQDYRWGETLPGFALGDAIASLRHSKDALPPPDVAALNDVGFIWDVAAHEVWDDIIRVLCTWFQHYPTMPLHDGIVLNEHEMWPSRMWHQPLGFYLTMLEVHEAFALPVYRSELAATGYDLTSRWRAKMAALKTYKALYLHLHVPRDFVVPALDGYWPPATHGLPLGLILEWLRRLRDDMADAIEADLDAIGLEWDAVDFSMHAPALAAYTKLSRGTVVVPPAFVIPNRAPWPVHVQGVALGYVVQKYDAYLAAMDARHGATLEAVMAKSTPPAPTTEGPTQWIYDVRTVVACLELYKTLHGDLDVPVLFVVPMEQSLWLQDAALLPLGYLVARFRDRLPRLKKKIRRCLAKANAYSLAELELSTEDMMKKPKPAPIVIPPPSPAVPATSPVTKAVPIVASSAQGPMPVASTTSQNAAAASSAPAVAAVVLPVTVAPATETPAPKTSRDPRQAPSPSAATAPKTQDASNAPAPRDPRQAALLRRRSSNLADAAPKQSPLDASPSPPPTPSGARPPAVKTETPAESPVKIETKPLVKTTDAPTPPPSRPAKRSAANMESSPGGMIDLTLDSDSDDDVPAPAPAVKKAKTSAVVVKKDTKPSPVELKTWSVKPVAPKAPAPAKTPAPPKQPAPAKIPAPPKQPAPAKIPAPPKQPAPAKLPAPATAAPAPAQAPVPVKLPATPAPTTKAEPASADVVTFDSDLFAVGAMIFHALHGHCLIDPTFVVPATDQWPESVRGMELGKMANALQEGRAKVLDRVRSQLDLLGFFEPPPTPSCTI